MTERSQHEIDVAHASAVTHQADAPGLPGHRAEAGADFNPILLEQAAPDGGIFRPGRDMDAVEGIERVFGHIADAHGFEALAQPEVHLLVPSHAVIKSLFEHDRERLEAIASKRTRLN